MTSSRTVIGLVAAAGLCASAGAQTTSWLDATSGDWLDALRWDNGVPMAGGDVVIDATGAAYTSSVTSEFSIASLLLDSVDASLHVNNGGILNLAGTATLNAGRMRFNGGRAVGGTIITGAGSSLEFSSSGGNILDGVLIQGDLDLTGTTSTVRARGGTDVTGTVRLASGGRLGLEGDQTIDWSIVSTGSPNTQLTLEGTNVSTTFGAGNTINGRRMDIGSAFAIGGTRHLTNDGLIAADVSDATGVRLRSMNSFTNQGVLEASNGGRLQVLGTVGMFTNQGQFNIGSGSQGDIASANWSNPGTVSVSDGALFISGDTDTASSGLNAGRITGDATSVLSLGATIDNTGQTLRTDDFGGEFRFNGGQLTGGVLETVPGANFAFTSNGNNILDGVDVQGDLDLTGSTSTVRVRNGTTVAGQVNLTNSGRLGLENDQAIDLTIRATGTSNSQVTLEGTDVTVTLGAASSIEAQRMSIGSAFAIGGTRHLINEGSIAANVANSTGVRIQSLSSMTNAGTLSVSNGGRLNILSTVGTFTNNGQFNIADATGDISASSWSNPGSINVTNGVLNLSGSYSTADTALNAGGITGDATSTLNLQGTLDNSGQTLRTDVFAGLLRFSGVRIIGGTLETTGSSDYQFTTSGNNILEGVDVQGDLDLAMGTATARIRSGTDVSGRVNLANGGRIGLEGDQTVEWDFDAAGAANSQITLEGINVTGTFGPGNTVTGQRLDIGSAFAIGGTRTLINQGTITAEMPSSAGVRFVSLASLVNEGVLQVSNDGTMQVTTGVSSFANNGQFNVLDSSATISAGSWQNAGTISATNGELIFSGSFATAQAGLNAGRVTGDAMSTLELRGSVDNAGQVLSTDFFGAGESLLGGATLSGGTLTTVPGARFRFTSSGSNILDGVDVQGDLNLDESTATVRVRNGTTVSGQVNLAGGGRFGLEGDQAADWTIRSTGTSTTQVTLEGTDVTATLGAGSTTIGRRLDIGSAFAIGGTRHLINEGLISAELPNNVGVRLLSLSSLTNDGVMEAVSEGRLQVQSSVMLFTNNGHFNVGMDSAGVIASDGWVNNGTINVAGGMLTVSGDFATGASGLNAGRITGDASSTLDLRSAIDNTGQMFRTDDFGGEMVFNSAAITGGSLQTTGPADYRFTSSTQNVLDGVQVLGDLDLLANSATTRLRNGTDVSGTINLSGGGRIGLEGDQTFEAAVLQTGATGSQVTLEGTDVSVTLGAANSIEGRRIDIGSAFAIGGTRTLVNQGRISGSTADNVGVRLMQLESFTNEGVLEALNGGRISVMSTVATFTNLDNGELTGGVYRIGGGSTMDLGGDVTVNSATIEYLGLDADLVGDDNLAVNEGTIVASGDAWVTFLGGMDFEPTSVLEIRVSGAGDSAVVPALELLGTADLDGQVVLDFSGYSLAGLTVAADYAFLDSPLFAGAFAGIQVVGIDPAFVLTDPSGGTFTLVPAPATGGVVIALGLMAARRRR